MFWNTFGNVVKEVCMNPEYDDFVPLSSVTVALLCALEYWSNSVGMKIIFHDNLYTVWEATSYLIGGENYKL